MARSTTRAWVNIAALVITIGVNALANLVPLNGQTTGAISDKFPIKFVPAGYVFSIWSVIYLALIAFAVYQALPKYRESAWVQRVGWLFAATCFFNATWIFAWHYEVFPLTVVLMLGLLATLIVLYRRLNVGREAIGRQEQWFVQVPFSLYLGWITVATIANIATVLYWAGWRGDPLSESAWAVLMLLAGLGITAAIAWRHRDVAYTLVILWAYVGIVVKQAALVAFVAGAAAALVLVLVLVAFFRSVPRPRAPRMAA